MKAHEAHFKGHLARVRICPQSVLHTQLTHAFSSPTIRTLPKHAVVAKGPRASKTSGQVRQDQFELGRAMLQTQNQKAGIDNRRVCICAGLLGDLL